MWGRGPRGNSATLCRFSVTSPTTHKQIGPFWHRFLGGWVYIHSRTLWVSPMNSPVSLGVSLANASTPMVVFSQRLWRLYFPALEHWIVWSVSLPSCSSWFICSQMWDCPVHKLPPCPSPPATSLLTPVLQQLPCWESSPPWLSVSAPPTGLDECSFFNSFIVRLPYSSIFCQFWLFSVFLNLLLSFFWLCKEGQYVYLHLHLGQKSQVAFEVDFLIGPAQGFLRHKSWSSIRALGEDSQGTTQIYHCALTGEKHCISGVSWRDLIFLLWPQERQVQQDKYYNTGKKQKLFFFLHKGVIFFWT